MNKTFYLNRLRKVEIFVVTLFVLLHMSLSFAQEIKVNLNALTQETQKMSEEAGEITLIWWIPEEYWRTSFEQDPNMTEAQIEEILKVLHPYLLISVVDGKVGAFGGVTYKPEATIQNDIQVIDRQGIQYSPLSDDIINVDMQNLLAMLKPVLVNMLGPLGQNMHFFLFPPKGKDGRDIAAAKEEGTFTVKLDKREFKWRLPLGSLLPQKVCPVDGEKLSGAWKFCPWHGVKLK